jgi:5'-deoxynucleotidase YfbR-like HD superfamily hydrolase
MNEFLTELDKTSHTKRWTIVDTFKEQTIDAHMYRTSMISLWISQKIQECGDFNKVMPYSIMARAMIHDWEEIYTGDIPATIGPLMDKKGLNELVQKDMSPFIKNLDEDPYHELDDLETLILKCADVLESLVFLVNNAPDSIHNKEVKKILRTNLEIVVCNIEKEVSGLDLKKEIDSYLVPRDG